jgi:hypothetical protein
MVLSERNQKVQVSPPECAQEPLTEGIGLGTPYRGFEDSQPQVAYTLVEILGEDCITVIHQEPIAMRGRNGIAQRLQRPVCGGMVGYVRMENSAYCVFHHDNHIEKPKGDRDHHAKVAGTMAAAWLRTNVRQRWEGMRCPRPGSTRFGMYFRTVRGDTRRPSLSWSSLVIRSSPHDGLSRAMQRMSACRSAGINGRPARDFHRQNNRNPWRCRRRNVAGWTTANAWRQSNPRASQTRVKRAASVARRGLRWRSW